MGACEGRNSHVGRIGTKLKLVGRLGQVIKALGSQAEEFGIRQRKSFAVLML